MGVRGLSTYVAGAEPLLLPHALRDTSLVVDGHSACAQLYRALHAPHSALGGDYDQLAAAARKLFLRLRRCAVTCYVLFDGSHERRKLRTAYTRLRSKISGASKLYPGNQASMQIFPLLLRDVFKQVLVELNIPHTVCEYEADDEIAALARHLNCPVLSYDSDFFIYNVLYIPFPTLNTKPVVHEEDGKKVYSMECKIYKAENFLNHFGGLKEELLPLFATLLGNDYVEKKVFRNFFSHLKLPKSKRKKNEQQRSIQALLEWLRNETLESAIIKIVGRVRKSQKHHVLAIVQKTCNGYNQKNCESLKYFNLKKSDNEELPLINVPQGIMDQEDISDKEDDDTTSDDGSSDNTSVGEEIDQNVADSELPAWFVNLIRQGSIPQQYINLYTNHLYFCIPQAEDYEAEDSFLPCLPLLRYAFDMLTNFSESSFIYVGREGRQYRKIDVPVEIALKPPFESVTSPFEDNSDRLTEYYDHFLKQVLPGLDYSCVELLPVNLKLVMIAILWWVKNCNVTLAQVYSLFLCYIMLEVVDEKTGTFRGDYFFHNKYSKKLEEIKRRPQSRVIYDETELFLNKNKVVYEDCLLTASALLKMFDMDNEMQKRPKSYDTQKVHSFAQFQCCLQQFNYLNTLCNCKYEGTVYYKMFNGTLAYNILNKLCDREDPLLFVEQWLKGADSVVLYFKSVCNVFSKNIASLGLKMALPKVKGKRRGRRKKGKDSISFLCEGFEAEVII